MSTIPPIQPPEPESPQIKPPPLMSIGPWSLRSITLEALRAGLLIAGIVMVKLSFVMVASLAVLAFLLGQTLIIFSQLIAIESAIRELARREP